jgi:multimeric flavodoxin WrbA
MKVLGICASPRGSQSQTLRLVSAILDGARSAGADVELVDVCKLHIEYCNGCAVCYKTGECTKKDDFGELYKKMLDSDGMVWGAPNYFRSVTAQMKTIIDRMADAVHCQLLTGKYCCSAATGGSNYDEVTTYLDELLLRFGSFVTGSVGAAMNRGPSALEEAEKNALTLGKTLVEDIRTKRDYRDQRKMLEENRKFYQRLVKTRGKDWEHEYEYWDKLNWK